MQGGHSEGVRGLIGVGQDGCRVLQLQWNGGVRGAQLTRTPADTLQMGKVDVS